MPAVYNSEDIQRLDNDMQRMFSIMQNTHEMLAQQQPSMNQQVHDGIHDRRAEHKQHDWFEILTNNVSVILAIAVAAVGFYNTTTTSIYKLQGEVTGLSAKIIKYGELLEDYKQVRYKLELADKSITDDITKLQKAVNILNKADGEDQANNRKTVRRLDELEKEIFKLKRELRIVKKGR